MRAFGRLVDLVRQEAPFPAGLILHSWAGSADVTASLAKLSGVYFSISGHLTRIAASKASAMLSKVPSTFRQGPSISPAYGEHPIVFPPAHQSYYCRSAVKIISGSFIIVCSLSDCFCSAQSSEAIVVGLRSPAGSERLQSSTVFSYGHVGSSRSVATGNGLP